MIFNSFNWLTSLVVYTDMATNDTPVFGIVELNYSDASDTAEIDINISVPSNEGSGVRNSIVTFTASLGE